MSRTILTLTMAFTAALHPEFAYGLQDSGKALNGTGSRPQLLLNAPGPLNAIVGKHRIRIAKEALGAWLIGDNGTVAYSTRDGAGGYENQGQALYLYNLRTERRRKIMSESFMIDGLEEVKTSTGKKALLVSMHDGGLGANHVAVVDPLRGEVFLRRGAQIVGRNGDTITVGFYRPEDADKRDARPDKTEHYDLKGLLRHPVIKTQSP